MEDIQTILDNHSIEVQGLLRKHKISGPLEIDTIKKGYDQKGDTFMMELLQIITPTSNFTSLQDYEASVATPVTATATTATTGKGWAFFDNLLNLATKTGATIGSVQNDVSGQATANATYLASQNASNSNMLYIVAAGFIALIIIILILKK